MTALEAKPRDMDKLLSRFLVFALVTCTVLPLVIFATDATNSRLVRAARASALKRAAALKRADVKQLDDSVRSERARASRARRHPGVGRVTESLAIELFWIVVIAAAGRRLFTLRL
ncbi:MAG: hypothetical protein ACREN6_05665 [Gemmatimonadaceae bacterium]